MINTINKAIAKRREELAENEKGFTLIELLVVVLIIGILAAIAIPAFLSQREGAWDSQVRADLRNASLAAESYAASNGGTFKDLTNAAASTAKKSIYDFGYNKTEGVTVAIKGTPGTTYELTGTNTNITGRTWTYSSVTGKVTVTNTP